MSLDTRYRGAIEKFIDQAVETLPKLLAVQRQLLPRELSIKEVEDYVLGFAQGHVISAFNAFYIMSENKPPETGMVGEALKILYRRSGELREALFKAG